MAMLYLMQGIPGSGKSTIARAISENTGAVIFSTDDYWYLNDPTKYQFDPNLIGEAHRWNQQRTLIRMMDAKIYQDEVEGRNADIIIDNTNIKNRDINPYLVLASLYNYTVQVVRVQVDPKLAIMRQHDRSADRRIPDDVIRRMNDKMEKLIV